MIIITMTLIRIAVVIHNGDSGGGVWPSALRKAYNIPSHPPDALLRLNGCFVDVNLNGCFVDVNLNDIKLC